MSDQPASEPKAKKSGKKKRTKEELKKARQNRRKRHSRRLKKQIKISVPIPEGLRKSWERENREAQRRRDRAKKIAGELPEKRAAQAKRIQGYEDHYVNLKKTRQENELKARLDGNFFKPADPKVMIIVRIRGINRVSPKVRKVLQLFRLLQIHNAVFVKVNKATINMLKVIQPYIAYGYPSVNTIRSLLYKRGFAKIRHRPGSVSRIPIMDNKLIERNLGKMKVETIEDMVYQIYTAGPAFRQVTNFLWPFKLNCPKGGYRGRKRRHFNEGGSYGNWEHHIGNFVHRML